MLANPSKDNTMLASLQLVILRHINRYIGMIGKKCAASGSSEVLPCGVTLSDVSGLS